jgi:hypothetical protein
VRKPSTHTKQQQAKLEEGAGAGRYQYIGMELCTLGDVEGYLRQLPKGILPVEETLAAVFQMLFAIFAARHEYKMRHYDLKLLNFLVSLPPYRS